jgi:hypothetical protein
MQNKNIDMNHLENSLEYNKTHMSPGIITTMIDIFLNMGSNEKNN